MKRSEAIDTVKLYWPIDEGGPALREAIETLIPELKESEDERIRNFLIDFIKVCGWSEKQYPPREDCMAWLEKQGLQNLANSEKTCKDEQNQPTEYTLEQAARIFLDALSDTPYNNKPVTDAQVITEELLKFLSDAHSYNPNAINKRNPAWSEEDEGIVSRIMTDLENCESEWGSDKKEEKAWLELLKGRVQPQPESEWSEEDRKALEVVTKVFEKHGTEFLCYPAFVHWLKTLPNRITFNPYWKPSDEQIKALDYVSLSYIGSWQPELQSLLNDLKKLTE